MDISAIVSLLKDSGPWALSAMGWYLYFQRDKRVASLEDWREKLLEKMMELAQRTSDVNHAALGMLSHADGPRNG